MAGASNIDHGVTIDLSNLSEVTLVDDDQAVWLGPGARWRDVYDTLALHGLTVSGGRVADVGVGGYVLGGGMSWFANHYGWTVDRVKAFQVVTPDRMALHADENENEELFLALKGSLGAFGIVTRIKVPTIRNDAIWGGSLAFRQENMPQVFAALERLTKEAEVDLNSQGFLDFTWVESVKAYTQGAYLVNTAANDSSTAFTAMRSIPHMYSSLRNMTVSESAREMSGSDGPAMRYVLPVPAVFSISEDVALNKSIDIQFLITHQALQMDTHKQGVQ